MVQQYRRTFLIFSGSNYRAIVAFCRELAELGLDFYIIARTASDLIFETRYRNNVVATREHDRLDLADIHRCLQLARSKSQFSQFIVAPSSEFLNLFLLKNREFFAEHGCEIPLVDLDTYERVSNKYPFSRLCKQWGIPIPAEFEHYAGLDFPFVAKPFKNVNAENRSLYPYLIYGEDDLREFQARERDSDFYYQEYIQGESHYLLLYLARDGWDVRFSQQNLIQQAGGKSIVLAKPSYIHNHVIANRFVDLLRDIGFYGLAMIEVMQ